MTVDFKRLIGKLSDASRSALELAAVDAMRRTHYSLCVEHLLLKIFEQEKSDASEICRTLQIDSDRTKREIIRELDQMKSGNNGVPAFDSEMSVLIQNAWLLSSINLSHQTVRTGHVILALRENPAKVPATLKVIDWNRLEDSFESITELSRETLPPDPGLSEPTSAPAAAARAPSRSAAVQAKVFISYRRSDSPLFVDALFNRLLAAGFRVFRDTNTLSPGAQFQSAINDTIASCDVLVAVIGKRWNETRAQTGRRRIDEPEDFVRIELETAFRLNKLVIPCLVGGAVLPDVASLPDTLRGLVERNAVILSSRRFQTDSAVLIDAVSRAIIH